MSYFCLVVPHRNMDEKIWITSETGIPITFPREDQLIHYVNYLIFLEEVPEGYLFIYDYKDYDLIKCRDFKTFKEWLIKEKYFDNKGASLHRENEN